jgi:sulfate adenylyltransferase subunit 2
MRAITSTQDILFTPQAYRPALSVDALHSTMSSARQNVSPHLKRLEAESMHIIREAIAEAQNPVMLYSVGKDSGVMLHLARKAFFPAPPPFPLLHVDTRWKFQEMYLFRDYMAQESGMDLLVHINVWTPKTLNKEQRQFFEKMLTDDNFIPHPEKTDKSFFEKVKDMFS